MDGNKKLNPMIEEIIARRLETVDLHLKNEESYVESLEMDLNKAKQNLVRLRKEKATYQTVLKTGDANFTEPFFYDSPKEFKVRE